MIPRSHYTIRRQVTVRNSGDGANECQSQARELSFEVRFFAHLDRLLAATQGAGTTYTIDRVR